jgi:hypothetical protein
LAMKRLAICRGLPVCTSAISYTNDCVLAPNPELNSDPACIVSRPLSTTRFLGSARRLAVGVAS